MNNTYPIKFEATMSAESVATIQEVRAFKVVRTKITTDEQYTQAADQLKKIKGYYKKVESIRKEITDPINEFKKTVMDDFNPMTDELDAGEKIIKEEMIIWDNEQTKLRIAAEAVAQEAARKEKEKLQAQAEKAAEKGKEEKVEALQMQAEMVVAAPVQIATAKVSGVSYKSNYSAVVTDLMELVKAVAAGTLPINCIQADTKFLNNQAKAMKETFNYAGCKLNVEKVIASRSA